MLLETLHASLRAAFSGRLLTGADAAPFLTDYRGKWTGQALAVVQPDSAEELANVVTSFPFLVLEIAILRGANLQ